MVKIQLFDVKRFFKQIEQTFTQGLTNRMIFAYRSEVNNDWYIITVVTRAKRAHQRLCN